MIIYLYGSDSYRRSQNLNKLIEGFRQKNTSFSEEYFNFTNENDYIKFHDFLLQQSMFSFKKLAVINNPFELDKDKSTKLKEILKHNIGVEEDFIIISSDAEPPKEFEFLLDLSKTNVHKFGALDGARMEHYINTEAEKLNISLTPKATALLLKLFSNNSWGLITELQKLQFINPSAAAQDNGKIDVKDIEETLVYFATSDIRSFSNLISRNGAQKQILPALENLFFNNEEPAKVFNFISANPFLNFETLKKMADYDVAVKSGKLDYETALLDLCL
ncbi:hypothetical protein COV23_00275 [Candidatus Wolfebacteria bacterium CG10_big_fil_rev_8_21_14_0_10_31_9]|uniref:Uncharacterized protein n=1 Tax=Candidatus Wolfebacteria bacterium CG10_big_fil_rev_8_21_14_0_10_31_9 TaxID=1975070 RepID=A0A2H0RCZ3_9BACT|nr:MAG: hypothetical protein COV23_00275 [Candidatus Wolfebacteria bacterium CG10_big_fil_rev_8_21_14_0_10_31_9]